MSASKADPKFSNQEDERCLLGAIIRDNSVFEDVVSLVAPEDFTSEVYRSVFSAISLLRRKGVLVDTSVLISEKVASPIQIFEIEDSVPTSANWSYYANKVVRYSMVRGCVSLGEKLRDATVETIDAVVDEVAKEIANIGDRRGDSGGVKTAAMLMTKLITSIELAIERGRKGLMSGYPTGFANLDRYTDGLQRELIFVGARPSIAKPAFGKGLHVNLAK